MLIQSGSALRRCHRLPWPLQREIQWRDEEKSTFLRNWKAVTPRELVEKLAPDSAARYSSHLFSTCLMSLSAHLAWLRGQSGNWERWQLWEEFRGGLANSAFCLCHLLLFEIHSKGWTEDRVEVVLGFAWLSFFFFFLFNPKFTLDELVFLFPK